MKQMMSRRSILQTLAVAAPTGLLLSQIKPALGQTTTPPVFSNETAENMAATEFVKVGQRTQAILATSPDQLTIRDARVEASTAFRGMAMFLTTDIKQQMDQILRTDSYWSDPALLVYRPIITSQLDAVGIDGILEGFAQRLHPDAVRFGKGLQARDVDPYWDYFERAVDIIATGLGTAAFLGCVPCGAVAAGMGVGMAILKAVKK
jgi:hypothetical protein